MLPLHPLSEESGHSGCSAVGSAPGLGPGGRPFESGHPDTENNKNLFFLLKSLQDSKKGCNFAAQKQNGALDEWLSQRSAKPSTAVRIRQAPPTKEGTNDSLFPLFLCMPVQIFSCPRPCRSPLRPSPSPEGRLHPAPECNFNFCSTVICSLFRLFFVPVPASGGVRLRWKPEMNFCSTVICSLFRLPFCSI